jgi:hypothetical protein
MNQRMTKEELVALVERIMHFDFRVGTEEDHSVLIAQLEANVPHPRVRDLIYAGMRELSAEEIVEEALSYKPIAL